MTWLGDNATILAALAATSAAVFSLASILIQVWQNRRGNRISSELTAHIAEVSSEEGSFRQLGLAHPEQHKHRFLYHSIRRSGWFWWLRRPCMSYEDRIVPAKKPSVWKRKVRFTPPIGNIGIRHKTIFISNDIPRPTTLVAEFVRIEETTRLRNHKIRVH